MKKSLNNLVACLFLLVLSSCSKSEGVTGTCSWSCDIDGVQYSWSGNYPPPSGRLDGAWFLQAAGSNASIILSSGNVQNADNLLFSFEPNPTPGNHNFNSSNSSENRAVIVSLGPTSFFGNRIYSSLAPGSNFNVNIPSIPSRSYLSTGSAARAGYFKGTFSGTLMESAFDPSEIEITNGKFEVMVLQND